MSNNFTYNDKSIFITEYNVSMTDGSCNITFDPPFDSNITSDNIYVVATSFHTADSNIICFNVADITYDGCVIYGNYKEINGFAGDPYDGSFNYIAVTNLNFNNNNNNEYALNIPTATGVAPLFVCGSGTCTGTAQVFTTIDFPNTTNPYNNGGKISIIATARITDNYPTTTDMVAFTTTNVTNDSFQIIGNLKDGRDNESGGGYYNGSFNYIAIPGDAYYNGQDFPIYNYFLYDDSPIIQVGAGLCQSDGTATIYYDISFNNLTTITTTVMALWDYNPNSSTNMISFNILQQNYGSCNIIGYSKDGRGGSQYSGGNPYNGHFNYISLGYKST
tara:strand:+ start:563 stop:1561 length:999 start_codon:yes stop_codon:yes gene_type:complete